jgi:hypothetical protein
MNEISFLCIAVYGVLDSYFPSYLQTVVCPVTDRCCVHRTGIYIGARARPHEYSQLLAKGLHVYIASSRNHIGVWTEIK